ncbi:proline racemase family protein [Kribbella sp. NPDC051952]|uniref:proline racemase family protein n=1 Tax=Kribbella sp. NPDC051952 TaxID=3154851 RepID=UPI0034232A26
MQVGVVDYHTGGEPFRIVVSGGPEIAGASVADRREYARHSDDVDVFRKLLVNEPRGHADMYGGFLVPPDDEGADLGVLFWHKDGYSTACGHGTIALGAWALATGLVTGPETGVTPVVIDVPSGRVTALVHRVDGAIQQIGFRNVPAYVVARGIEVETARGTVYADISFGGAFYASVRAESVGLAVTAEHYGELVALGCEVKWALNETDWVRHPTDNRLDGLYGTILYDDLGRHDTGPHQRNLTVFADGEADRSPCGSGTSARLALVADEGLIGAGEILRHDSIVGSTFWGRIVENAADGVITEIEGTAYETGRSTFTLDPADELGTGFVLR